MVDNLTDTPEKEQLNRTNRRTVPASCDILENNSKIMLKIEMPGVGKENLDIKIDGNLLKIYGKKVPDIQENGRYLVHEIRDADYYQEYAIDETIDRNKIEASLEQGILTLILSVKESEKPRKIDITTR
jgi:HSP20 family protein